MRSNFSPFPFAALGILLGAVSSVSGQDTYNWVGGTGGANRGLFTETSWDPALAAIDRGEGTSPTLIIATRNNGSSEDLIGGGLHLGVGVANARVGHLIFDDTDGHFPANLIIAGNQGLTTARVLHVEQPNTTFITLTENTTGTVTLGYERATYGNLSFRLPVTGVSTIHVAHPAATLDLSGLFDNITGRGGISAGDTTYTPGGHAILRKTGAGTLDLRTADSQGHRVGGTIIEGGTVIISSTLQLGWAPPSVEPPDPPNEAVPDMVVINGGTLRTTNSGAITNSTLRGFQIGENGATIEVTGGSFRLPNTFADIPGQAGVLIKAGPGVLGFQNAEEGTTHSGGTLLQQGEIHLVFDTGSLGAADGLGITAASGTMLRGMGGINGDSTFAAGATLRPDTMSSATNVLDPVGTLTFNHSVSLGEVSLIYDLAAPGVSDLIHVAGVLDIGIGLLDLTTFTFTAREGFGAGSYTLVSTGGGMLGELGTELTGMLGDFPIELGLSAGGDAIVLTVIPEPAAYAALFGLVALVVVRRFRRAR